MAKREPGRPTIYDKPLSKVVTLRFTKNQEDFLQSRAKPQGMTIPQYIRWLVEEMRVSA